MGNVFFIFTFVARLSITYFDAHQAAMDCEAGRVF